MDYKILWYTTKARSIVVWLKFHIKAKSIKGSRKIVTQQFCKSIEVLGWQTYLSNHIIGLKIIVQIFIWASGSSSNFSIISASLVFKKVNRMQQCLEVTIATFHLEKDSYLSWTVFSRTSMDLSLWEQCSWPPAATNGDYHYCGVCVKHPNH